MYFKLKSPKNKRVLPPNLLEVNPLKEILVTPKES